MKMATGTVKFLRDSREIANTIRDNFYNQDVIGLSLTDNYIILSSTADTSIITINPQPRYSDDIVFLLNSTIPKKIVFDKNEVITLLRAKYPDVKCRSIIDIGDVATEYHEEELYESVVKTFEEEVDDVIAGEKTDVDYAITMAQRALAIYLEITQKVEKAGRVSPPVSTPEPMCFFAVLNELNHELRRSNGQLQRQDLIRRFAGRTKRDCPFEKTLDFMVERQYLHQRGNVIYLL